MTQQHLDRLTAIDASFLAQETAVSHMHVGAITIFEGPPPSYDEITEARRSRLHLVPRYRQKLAVPPLGTGRPLWADDPDFNLEYNVRQSALPAPGSEEQLFNLASRVFSQQLDRSKPLWELGAVEGLEDGRFALISKTHHALIDGIAGVDLATVMFDLEPAPKRKDNGSVPWSPEREPAGGGGGGSRRASPSSRPARATSSARGSTSPSPRSAPSRIPSARSARRSRPPRGWARWAGRG